MNTSKSSYSYSGWQRLRSLCLAMRQTEEKVQKLKEDIESKLKITQKIRDKRADIQSSHVAIHSLESQLELRKGKVRTLSARLSKQRRNFGERDAKLLHFRKNVEESEENLAESERNYIAKREKLIWIAAQLFMRRKQLVQDLMFAYPVEQRRRHSFVSTKSLCLCQQFFTISNVHLPDAESYSGHNEVDLSVGLGYVCHLLQILSRIFNIPLRYKLLYYGSRSSVFDSIDPHLPCNQTIFPLFFRGQDKAAFQYGVFLLNKNIAQFRCDCGMSTQDLRCTLQNLLSLMDYLSGVKIEPFTAKPVSKLNVSPPTNSMESSTVSIPETDHESYQWTSRDRVFSFGNRTALSAASSVAKVRSMDALDLNTLNSANNNNELSNFSIFVEPDGELSNFSSKSLTPVECIEHNKKILQTCYFKSDDFLDDDDAHKRLLSCYENGQHV